MKRIVIFFVVVGALGAGGWVYYVKRNTQEMTVNTSPVSRGDIIEAVGSTGTLQAVTTVQVGSQVSGSIQWLGADFNSIVKKDQVIAKLDPSLIQAQLNQSSANLAQARANLGKAQSDLERMKVMLLDAQQKYTRAKELAAKELLPQSNLDTAKTTVDSAQASMNSQQASVRQAEAAVTQAQASVNQNTVNLEHTIITAPIDGIITQRSVDVGQTVNAGLSASTLFIIAADLTKMQVNANIDESDVGKIRPGQRVTFRVDAYPTDMFEGSVTQIRLQPVVVSNVTTYGTIINVPNPDLKLKPGMTANLKVEIHHASGVVRVPNTALRYRPTTDVFAALNQPVPPEALGGAGGGRRTGGGRNPNGNAGNLGGAAGGGGRAAAAAPGTPQRSGSGASAPAAPGASAAGQTASADQQGRRNGNWAGRNGGNAVGSDSGAQGGNAAAGGPGQGGRGGQGFQGSSGGRGGQQGQGGGGRGGPGQGGGGRGAQQMDRFNAMTSDEQQQFIARMKSRGVDTSMFEAAAKKAPKAPSIVPKYGEVSPASIDALFPPLPSEETQGRAWLYADKQLKPINLRLGITDGTNTEVLSGDAIQPGQEVVTSVSGVGAVRPVVGGNNNGNPLLGNQQRGGPPGGFGGGGGGGRGR